MEKINRMSSHAKDILTKQNLIRGDCSLGYKTDDGAEVYIWRDVDRSKKYGYDAKADVHVVNNDKVLSFYMGEHIGNEAGTIWTHAHVGGLPNRKTLADSPNDGMYDNISYTKEEQIEGEDLFTRAAKIYDRYEKETDGQFAIGTAFRKYVPDSYDNIRQYFTDKEKQAEKEKNDIARKKQMDNFKNNLLGF